MDPRTMTGGGDGGMITGARRLGQLAGQPEAPGTPNQRPRLVSIADRLSEHCKLLHAMVEGARASLDRIQGQLPPEDRERNTGIEGQPGSAIAQIEYQLGIAIQLREALMRQLYRLEGI